MTVMTFSEFGRTSWSNDGRGTDHGTAAPHFVFGAESRAGCTASGRRCRACSAGTGWRIHVDFRDYYGSVIDGWMGGGGSDVVGKPVRTSDCSSRPDVADDPAPGVVPVVGAAWSGRSGGVPATDGPVRRVSPGAGVRHAHRRRRPLGAIAPGETVNVQITGVGGVPATASSSVALNVTSVNATRARLPLGLPGGMPVPSSSSLNPSARPGDPQHGARRHRRRRAVSVFNKFGPADCIVDVLGYFHPSHGAASSRSCPTRLLDTRSRSVRRPAGSRRRNVRAAGHRPRWRARRRRRCRGAQPHRGHAEQRAGF